MVRGGTLSSRVVFYVAVAVAEEWWRSGGGVVEWWRSGGGVVEEWWRNGGGVTEEWWRSGGRVVVEWWRSGGRVVDEWWMSDGGVMEEWWRSGGGANFFFRLIVTWPFCSVYSMASLAVRQRSSRRGHVSCFSIERPHGVYRCRHLRWRTSLAARRWTTQWRQCPGCWWVSLTDDECSKMGRTSDLEASSLGAFF